MKVGDLVKIHPTASAYIVGSPTHPEPGDIVEVYAVDPDGEWAVVTSTTRASAVYYLYDLEVVFAK